MKVNTYCQILNHTFDSYLTSQVDGGETEKSFSKPLTIVVHELILQLYNKTRRMSGLTDEWLLKISENCIKYVIDIDNFDKKIKTFRPGREIHSKKLKLDDQHSVLTFTLQEKHLITKAL